MQINTLKLANYRNHKKVELEFDPNLTLIIGPNGAGKTNILEAIHLLSTTKPYRAHYDSDTITHKKTFTRIESNIYHQEDLENLVLTIRKKENSPHASIKQVKLNGIPKTLRNFSTNLNTVLFSPEDIEIITNSPSRKRKFIDSILIQVDSTYKKALTKYTKAVRRRNKVLEMIRDYKRGHNQLRYWDEQILETGVLIQQKREELFDFLEIAAREYLKDFDEDLKISIIYRKNEISKKRLESHKEKAILAKSTLVGPHRDKFEILMGSHNIAFFGSRGQQRSTLLALKLAEIEFFAEKTEKRPVLLLDDIFSELDEPHQKAVFDIIGKQQTIITSTEGVEGLGKFKEIRVSLND